MSVKVSSLRPITWTFSVRWHKDPYYKLRHIIEPLEFNWQVVAVHLHSVWLLNTLPVISGNILLIDTNFKISSHWDFTELLWILQISYAVIIGRISLN